MERLTSINPVSKFRNGSMVRLNASAAQLNTAHSDHFDGSTLKFAIGVNVSSSTIVSDHYHSAIRYGGDGDRVNLPPRHISNGSYRN